MSTNKQVQEKQDDPARKAATDNSPKPQRKSKQALLLELIGEAEGATLEDLTTATGWLPHTTRAAITGLRKRGNDVQCKRVNGVSRYVIGSGDQ